MQQAEEKLGRLTLSGKGRKVWREEQELRSAVAAIEVEYGVKGCLSVTLSQETTEQKKHGKPGRPGIAAVTELIVEVRHQITKVSRNDPSFV